jgi:uncharacterized protein
LTSTAFDEAHSDSEDRWFTLGLDTLGGLLAVAHTYEITGSANGVRIISARKATKSEQRTYGS